MKKTMISINKKICVSVVVVFSEILDKTVNTVSHLLHTYELKIRFWFDLKCI